MTPSRLERDRRVVSVEELFIQLFASDISTFFAVDVIITAVAILILLTRAAQHAVGAGHPAPVLAAELCPASSGKGALRNLALVPRAHFASLPGGCNMSCAVGT
jgi:hypothetical protein